MPKQIDITTPSDNQIKILERLIGADQPCFIIAEAGVNHNGDMNLAHKLIDAAIAAGADAIKFQSFIAEDLVTAGTPKANYQVETTGTDDGQFGMLKALELSAGQQAEIKGHCDEGGIIYLCTPYEEKVQTCSIGWMWPRIKSRQRIPTTFPFSDIWLPKDDP